MDALYWAVFAFIALIVLCNVAMISTVMLHSVDSTWKEFFSWLFSIFKKKD